MGGGKPLITTVIWTSILVTLAILLWIFRDVSLKNVILKAGKRTPRKLRQSYQESIELLGIDMLPEYLAGIKYGATVALGGIALIAFAIKANFLGIVLIAFAAFTWVYPDRWLQNMERKRREDIAREFPIMVTLVKVYSHASDLNRALNIVRFALKGELRRQLDILAGELAVFPMKEVLERFAYRCQNPLINNFVSVVLFGIQTGSNVDEILDTFARRSYEIRVNEIKRKIKAQPVIMSVLPAIMMFALILLFIFPMYANIINKLRAF